MAFETSTWHAHYLELQREGEAAGHRFGALGEYIARRLTPAELRDVLRNYYEHGGNNARRTDTRLTNPPISQDSSSDQPAR